MNTYISEMKVASIMTQSTGHIMYSGRVLNTSLRDPVRILHPLVLLFPLSSVIIKYEGLNRQEDI